MRTVSLSAVKAGMTRMRDKGGASPESLFDLLNGYVNAARMPQIRPGTTIETTTLAGTKGAMAHQGKIMVFADEPVTMTDPDYVCGIVRHPTDDTLTLSKVHFASPFMNAPYVIAEFSDGSVFHYWLEDFPEWTANTSFNIGDRVVPTVANGYAYEAQRVNSASPKWAADVPRTVGDIIEPTVYNGFYYECVEAEGDNPVSGTTEPTWPVIEDAIVIEDTAGADFVYPGTPGDDSNTDPTSGNGANATDGNYSNPGGNLPPRWEDR